MCIKEINIFKGTNVRFAIRVNNKQNINKHEQASSMSTYAYIHKLNYRSNRMKKFKIKYEGHVNRYAEVHHPTLNTGRPSSNKIEN
jgi:hypothetical protein